MSLETIRPELINLFDQVLCKPTCTKLDHVDVLCVFILGPDLDFTKTK